MRVNTLKLSNRYNSTTKHNKKAILLLTLILVLVTFNLPLLKQQFEQINFRKSPRCRVVGSKCDISRGKWVLYHEGPYYTNVSECVIQDGQNCMKFGRTDTEFMKWRWKPDECELPLFDAARFLELLKGKSMAFVGDSLARNQMQSLGCLLSHVARFVDESNTQDRGFRRWFYADYNFTLMFLRTTHLVKAHGADTSSINPIDLYLDEVDDSWATKVVDFDYVIISAGHWFSKQLTYYENHKVVGCSLCKEKNITDLTMYYGYRTAFQTAFRTLLDLQNFKGTVFLRTVSPTHFEAEEREGRGNCIRTRPYEKQEMKFDWYVWMLHMIQLEQFREAKREARGRELKFKLLDITEAMRLRSDGHPNHYGHSPEKKKQADCVHWCLPGPIDMWNQVLLHILEAENIQSLN